MNTQYTQTILYKVTGTELLAILNHAQRWLVNFKTPVVVPKYMYLFSDTSSDYYRVRIKKIKHNDKYCRFIFSKPIKVNIPYIIYESVLSGQKELPIEYNGRIYMANSWVYELKHMHKLPQNWEYVYFRNKDKIRYDY